MPNGNKIKVYVDVDATFNQDGKMIPRSLVWEDGTRYVIDKVRDIRQAAAMRAGGQGDRYEISINGHQSYLFFERSTNLSGNVIGRWFVERKEPSSPKSNVVGTVRFADGGHGKLYSGGIVERD
jgi:hypothetical protein